MALQRRNDDKIRTRLVRVREILFEIVRIAFRAGLVVSEFDVEVVPGLQETALTVGVRARGKPALALVADCKVCRRPTRKTRADARIVLEREVRRVAALVGSGRVVAEPHRPADVHVGDRAAANRPGRLRLLHHGQGRERGVLADDHHVDCVVVVGFLRRLEVVRRKLHAPGERLRLAGGENEMLRVRVAALGEKRHVGIRR